MAELIVAFARSGTASLRFDMRFRYNAAFIVASARTFFASTQRRSRTFFGHLNSIIYNI